MQLHGLATRHAAQLRPKIGWTCIGRAAATQNATRPSMSIKHERALELLTLWDTHIATEFTEKSAAAAVATMVPDAQVVHVPTLTGGKGAEMLRQFYATHFIPQMPPDLHIQPVSRAVGRDMQGTETITDEFIISFTHSTPMTWMLPGVAPTHQRVMVPFVAVVRFQGNKLCEERIYWDQATVLKQLGLLPDTIHCVPGPEQTAKLLDFASVPSDSLIPK